MTAGKGKRTVHTRNLAPDGPDLGAADLLRGAVDEGDALAEVEPGAQVSQKCPTLVQREIQSFQVFV